MALYRLSLDYAAEGLEATVCRSNYIRGSMTPYKCTNVQVQVQLQDRQTE